MFSFARAAALLATVVLSLSVAGRVAIAREPQQLTIAEAVAHALAEAKQQRLDTAFAVSRYFQARNMPAAANILLARAYRLSMDYDRAAQYYRLALAALPRSEIHTELAVMLAKAGDVEAARFHLERSLELGPPPPLRSRTETLLTALIGRPGPYGFVNAGVSVSQNINDGSSSDKVDIQGLMFELDDDARAKSGYGPFIDLQLGYRWPLGPATSVFAEADAYTVQYLGAREDRQVGGIEIGVERRPKLWLVRPSLRYAVDRFADEHIANVVELGLLVSPPSVGSTRLAFRLAPALVDGRKHGTSNYARTRLEASTVTSVGARLRLRTDLSFALEEHDVDSDDNVQVAGGVGIDVYMPVNVIGRIGGGLGYRRHDQKDAFFGARREDRIARGYTRLVIPDLQLAGFAPELGLFYEVVHSTLAYFDRKGAGFDFRFVRQF